MSDDELRRLRTKAEQLGQVKRKRVNMPELQRVIARIARLQRDEVKHGKSSEGE